MAVTLNRLFNINKYLNLWPMRRRNALKKLGAGLSAGFMLPWLASCTSEEPAPKAGYKGTVAVIGGGAAGLFAADYLLSKGINVIVYEASNRIGGRVRTLRPNDRSGNGLWFNEQSKFSADFPLELGADRIYGDDSVLARFVRNQKFTTMPLEGEAENLYWVADNLFPTDDALAYHEFQQAYDFLQNIVARGETGLTVQDAIAANGIPASMMSMLHGRIGNRMGTSNNRIGIEGFSEELMLRKRSDKNLILAKTSMADVLIEGYIRAAQKTQLNTIIRNINYEGDRIVLSGEADSQPFTTEVDKVIVTVPVSVLKAGDITFTPALPSTKQTALSLIGMDSTMRVVIDFKRNFWGSGFKNIFGGDIPEYFNAGEGRSEVARALQMTISGEKAEMLSNLGYDAIPAILEELDLMFDNQASRDARVDAVNAQYVAAIQDWGKEPFIKGSMSYLKPGGTVEHRRELSRPLLNKVFFAGEATDFTGEAGTVNGALQSAERAGREILEVIAG